MHLANQLFWEYCNKKYSTILRNASIIEFGSLNVNGSARTLLQGYKSWIGVDWRPGDCVDVVSLAHQVTLGQHEVVFSCSMLEHDPYWELSVPNMVKHMKESGVLLLSWGAALNPAHCLETAPDGEFHMLPAGNVLALLKKLGIYVHEFWYEANFANEGHMIDGRGEVCLVAFSDKKYSVGDPHFDTLLPEDKQTH